MRGRAKQESQRKREAITLGEGIGEYLNVLVNRQNKTSQGKTAKKSLNLMKLWQQSAPAAIVEHTQNVVYSTRSKETEILVYLDTAVYATELSLDKELYRVKLAQALGKELADIKFLVAKARREVRQ